MTSDTSFADVANLCNEFRPLLYKACTGVKGDIPHFLRDNGHGDIARELLAFDDCVAMMSAGYGSDTSLSNGNARKIFSQQPRNNYGQDHSSYGNGLTRGNEVLSRVISGLKEIQKKPEGLDGYDDPLVAGRWDLAIKNYNISV